MRSFAFRDVFYPWESLSAPFDWLFFPVVPLFTLLPQYNHLTETDVAAVAVIHDPAPHQFEIRAPLAATRGKIL